MAKLNDLTGKEWIRFTKSWFKVTTKSRNDKTIIHPAKFPEELVDDFINFFTKENEIVFDPFLGVGSTIVSAERNNRKAIGIELNRSFYEISKSRCSKSANIILGDARTEIDKIKKESIDFIMTSPPYWNILSKKRGNSDSQHKDRERKGLKLNYSDLQADLGNITEYDLFLKELVRIFSKCQKVLKNGKYMVIVIQNFRNTDGKYLTLAWDIAKKLGSKMDFVAEKVWIQDDKKLGIWGFPSTFVPNIHHHYCLIFKKRKSKNE